MISNLNEFLPFPDVLLHAVRKRIQPDARVTKIGPDNEASITFAADGIEVSVRISHLNGYLKTQSEVDRHADITARHLVFTWAEQRYLREPGESNV